MNLLASEWVQKSEAARRELAAAKNYDAVCLHAQQCVEKLVTAVLAENSKPFPKTHDLILLETLVKGAAPSWVCDRSDLLVLVPAAVDYRYPGFSAGAADATSAVEACERLCKGLRSLLP